MLNSPVVTRRLCERNPLWVRLPNLSRQDRIRLTNSKLGFDLREVREAAGLSVRQFAEAADLSINTVRWLETGITCPNSRTTEMVQQTVNRLDIDWSWTVQ